MSTDDPTLEQVRVTLRKALYARDPFDRADATTQLAWWGLPASIRTAVRACQAYWQIPH